MLIYVALGSALGGMSRYLLGGLVQRLWATSFPTGTLFVNFSGSFLLGLIIRYALQTPSFTPEIRALLTIEFCGGHTMFSPFSYQATVLLGSEEWGRASLYISAN